MSKTLKLEISVADLGQNGVVVSEFATTDYVANELSKKATLNAEGKVDPSLLPDYTYLDGLVDKLDDVEQSFLNSDAEILNAAKLYSDNKISENNSKKADLVEGKVPFEQLPFSMNFEQNVSTEFGNVRQELRQNSENIVAQMDGIVGSANSYTDGKVLEEREFLNNTINEYKGEVNSQLNNFGNEIGDILKSGAYLPYDPDLEYVEGALILKDGEIQQFVEGVWLPFKTNALNVVDVSGESQQQVNYNGGSKWHSRVGGYKLNERVVLANGDIVKSAIDGNTADPNVNMTGWVSESNKIIYASKYGLNNDSSLDQSEKLQNIADIAKSGSRMLVIDSLSDAVYAVMNVDITGLTVEVSPTVSFIAPTTATNQYTFIALGASGNLAPQTILKNAKLDAAGRMRGVFKADYVNEPLAYKCSAINVPTGVSPDGSGVVMYECIKPRVKGGFYHGGRQGVLFSSCTNPEAEGVETDYQGRDGILFYTNPTGTTTTDAVSINCKATRFALNSEMGRAGIHFYGVRRAKAITPTVSNDNNQPHDDTGAVRFRDCEDYYTEGYDVENVRVGVLINEIGDYSTSPHNIVVRGAIGAGNVKNTQKFGIAIAVLNRICNIIGAVVTNSGQLVSGAGIYTASSGSISGCTVDGTTLSAGIYAGAGKNTITGNTLRNAGRSNTNIAQIAAGGETVISGNSFENSDGTSEIAVRVFGSGKSTVGANNYDANTKQMVVVDADATLKQGSSLVKTKFAGIPTFAGTVENGVQAIDTNNVVYIRESGAWKRQAPKAISATVGIAQTTIAHGLGYTPTEIGILVKSNANVWQSAVADATNVYLTASVASTSIDIRVR